MQLGFTVNAADLPQSTSNFDVLPAGDYQVRISEAAVQATKAGTGQYIKLRLDVTGPSHQGRVIYTNLNIQNPNPKAEEIGRQQLGDIMRACGLASLSDTDQLINGCMTVKVAVTQSEQYGPGNDVKAFKPSVGGASAMPAATPAFGGTPAPAPQQQAPAAAFPPWATR